MDISNVSRLCKADKYLMNRTCSLCGQYFKKGEEVGILIPTQEYRKIYNNRLRYNMLAHYEDIDEIASKCMSVDEFWHAVGKSKKPKTPGLTDSEIEMCNKFEIAVAKMGYYFMSRTKTGIKCKKVGATDILEYSVKSNTIEYSNKRKGYMFDALVKKQIVTTAWNHFCEATGNVADKKKEYNALKEFGGILNKAVDTANKIVGG